MWLESVESFTCDFDGLYPEFPHVHIISVYQTTFCGSTRIAAMCDLFLVTLCLHNQEKFQHISNICTFTVVGFRYPCPRINNVNLVQRHAATSILSFRPFPILFSRLCFSRLLINPLNNYGLLFFPVCFSDSSSKISALYQFAPSHSGWSPSLLPWHDVFHSLLVVSLFGHPTPYLHIFIKFERIDPINWWCWLHNAR